MAWNDVYADDNAVQLLITVGGKQFNFKNGVDIKVERKIGDTMSKFSLGIVGDDSETFYDFEQRILRIYTEIKVSYGNSTKAMSSFVGMVVDYQPVFLGNSTKLTVTGYLSKVTSGVSTSKLTSAYTYWIDWTPLVGVRRDETQDWADIYDGNFRFSSDMTVEDLETTDEKILSQEEADALIKENLTVYDAKVDTTRKALLTTALRAFNEQDWVYTTNYGDPHDWSFKPILTIGGISEVLGVTTSAPVMDDGTVNMFYGDVEFEVRIGNYEWTDLAIIGDRKGSISIPDMKTHIDFMESAPDYLRQAAIAYQNAVKNRVELELQLKNIYSVDTWGNLSGVAWDYGHVPWIEAVNHYKGNILFGEFTHPYTGNSIWRVRPDLFIEWDNELPGLYYDEEDTKRTPLEQAQEFPDTAINDIKVFGLKYRFNEKVWEENPTNPYAAYTLSPKDMHGKFRLFEANNKYYVWVGDIPDLYLKWKTSEWKYNEKKDPAGKIFQDGQAVQWHEQQDYKKGQIIINNWSGYQTIGGGSERAHKVPYPANGEIGKATRDFNAGKYKQDNGDFWFFHWGDQTLEDDVLTVKALNSLWDDAVRKGWIELMGDEDDKYGDDYHTYKIKDLTYDKKTGRKAMTAKERIIKYLQAAFRSGDVIAYGQVYISDIVLQLCALEGWSVGKVVSTTASSYKASYLSMNGATALEYIATTLAENAIEAEGSGRAGFKAYFSNDKFNFEPVNLKRSTSSVLTMGYNQANTPVLSFTVRSRGQILMMGIDENISETNAYTNESTTSLISRSDREMTTTEKDLYEAYVAEKGEPDDPIWFNASWFNYYGYEKNVENFETFTTRMASGERRLAYGSGLVQNIYRSSSSSSTETLTTALKSLESLRQLCIQAEMTIIGDNKLAPGDWITVNNITARGNHYTSGDYFINSITDQVTTGGGFTQNLVMWRYSKTQSAFNNDVTNVKYAATSSARSMLQKAGERLRDGSFSKWYEDNADFKSVDLEDSMLDTVKEYVNDRYGSKK